MQATSNYIPVEGRELHYMEWGAGNRETVIAWHGLARTGRDMDDIAAHLARRWRVICPAMRPMRRVCGIASFPGSGEAALGKDRIQHHVVGLMRQRRNLLPCISDADSGHLQLGQCAIIKAAAITQPMTRTVECQKRHQ